MSGRVDDEKLPSAPRSLVRAMVLAYRTEPRLLVVSFVLVAGAWVPDSLAAVWLRDLVDGVTVTGGDAGLVHRAAVGLAAAAAAGWFLRTLGSRIEQRFRERATIELEAHVAHLQASVSTIDHHERPALLDRLELLREQVFLLNHLYAAVMDFVGSAGRIVITVGLLASVDPRLVVLVVFALPNVWVSSKRAEVERAAMEGAGSHRRLQRHLVDVATSAASAKELRTLGTRRLLLERRAQAWSDWFAATAGPRRVSAVLQAAAWALFGVAYAGAVWVVESDGKSPGQVILVLAAGAALSQFVGVTMGQTQFLRWTIDAAQRLVWLEDYAAAGDEGRLAPVPDRLADGVRIDQLSFRYPGSEPLVLDNVDLHLPGGSVVAIVGENGAGKTTLVKLLLGLYSPTSGTITVDGVDLATMSGSAWRARAAGAFQDFFPFEYTAQRSIGVGNLDHLDDRRAVERAVDRAGADDVVARLPRGLDSQLGPTWDDGVEVSIGQWQKLALARGLLRAEPLLVVLDEPTASLDAETEHALFERFAGAARAENDRGQITVLVSHRFSTVRMADLIVVLDGSRVAEVGSHRALVDQGGLYAELFELQAASYR